MLPADYRDGGWRSKLKNKPNALTKQIAQPLLNKIKKAAQREKFKTWEKHPAFLIRTRFLNH